MANAKLQNMTAVDWRKLLLNGLSRPRIQLADRLGAFYITKYLNLNHEVTGWRWADGNYLDEIRSGVYEWYDKDIRGYIIGIRTIESILSFDSIENADISLLEDYLSPMQYAKLQFLISYLKGEAEGAFDNGKYKESERNAELCRKIDKLEVKLLDTAAKNKRLMEQISQYKKEIKELSKVKNLLIKSHKALGDAISDLD